MNARTSLDRSGRWSILRLTVILSLALAGGGCVTFEKETAVVAFPPGKDEIRILLIYEGVQASDSNAGTLKTAREQLTRFVTSQEEFCLGDNWITHVVMTTSKDDSEQTKQLRNFLKKHIAVKNGAFFDNKDGKLSGYQTVTVRQAKQFVEDLNGLISPEIVKLTEEALASPDLKKSGLDVETLERLQRAGRELFAWVRLEPGRVSFTAPLSFALLARGRHDLAKQLTESLKSRPTELEPLLKFLAEVPISLDQRKNQVTVSLGVGEGEPFTLLFGDKEKPVRHFEKELRDHARSLRPEFLKDATTEGLIAEFLKGAYGERR